MTMVPIKPIGETRAISTAIGGLLAIAAAIGIGRFVYTPILPPMIAAMGLSGTIPTFLMLRFVGGAASAFVLIIASTVVLERLASVGRSGLSALYFAGVGSGIAV